MLISTKAVKGCVLENGEGHVGTVQDLFFNDESWTAQLTICLTAESKTAVSAGKGSAMPSMT